MRVDGDGDGARITAHVTRQGELDAGHLMVSLFQSDGVAGFGHLFNDGSGHVAEPAQRFASEQEEVLRRLPPVPLENEETGAIFKALIVGIRRQSVIRCARSWQVSAKAGCAEVVAHHPRAKDASTRLVKIVIRIRFPFPRSRPSHPYSRNPRPWGRGLWRLDPPRR